ncbi:teichoic acid biosynthesis protein [Listeria monocytogenes]|nr:teichoic acid biosynthesis protein [Listeria monocytogenes]EEP0531562.1 teichoic acid biosynthesis protein [Listeria monocytogenes]EIN8848013.1 teichoic acid biosynthesis protein [Listeria monocytogenes]
MKFYIKEIQLTDSNTWKLQGFSEGKITSIQAYYNEVREYVHPEQKLNIPFTQEKNSFTATISVDDLANLSLPNNQTFWKFKVNGDYPYTHLITDGPIINKPFKPENSLYQYHFDFPEGILTLVSKPTELQASIESYTLDSNTMSGSIKIKSSLPNSQINAKLVFKRRPTPSFYLFHEQHQSFDLGVVTDNKISFSIPVKDLSTDFLVDNTNILDAMLEVSTNSNKTGLFAFLSIDPDMKPAIPREIEIGEPLFASLRSYVTGSNRLSFYFKKNIQGLVSLSQLKETKKDFTLQFKIENSISEGQIVAKRADKKANTFEYNIEQIWPVKKGLTKYSAQINKNEFLTGPINKPDTTWDFFLRSANKPDLPISVPSTIDLSASEFFDIAGKEFKAQLTKNEFNNLACLTVVAPKIKEDVTKIAIMGTDFSLNAFNSSPFFNPDYKAFFECSFTQFHSSIISLMTKPANLINLDKYTDIKKSEQSFVEEDWKKEFFTNLKNSNSDYFLIDLYPDVIRPVIWLNDETAITLSYVIEQSQLLNDIPYERISDHIDNEAYFNEWKGYADQFIEKLTEIIPANRVILNLGGFTTSYYDEDGKIVTYKNKMAIEKNNYFWDRLNNYFLSKLPEAKVIDFSKKGYIGDFNYPFGHSFSHFESPYYKDFLKELIYITKS